MEGSFCGKFERQKSMLLTVFYNGRQSDISYSQYFQSGLDCSLENKKNRPLRLYATLWCDNCR